MKTKVPVDLIDPNVITDVIRSGSSLHFTYGDGSSENIDLLTIGQAVLAAATTAANASIANATFNFVLANPASDVEGAIKTSGIAAFVFNDSWIQVTP